MSVANVRETSWYRSILRGITSTAIGIIASASVVLYASAVTTAADNIIFVISGGLAVFYNVAAPAIIIIGALAGSLLSLCDLGQVPMH